MQKQEHIEKAEDEQQHCTMMREIVLKRETNVAAYFSRIQIVHVRDENESARPKTTTPKDHGQCLQRV